MLCPTFVRSSTRQLRTTPAALFGGRGRGYNRPTINELYVMSIVTQIFLDNETRTPSNT